MLIKRGLGFMKMQLLHRPKSPKITTAKCFCLNNDKGSGKDKENYDNIEFPDEPTTCCMSGCANCVWLEYAEKMSQYFKDGGERAVKEINERVNDPNIRAFLLQELRMRKLTRNL